MSSPTTDQKNTKSKPSFGRGDPCGFVKKDPRDFISDVCISAAVTTGLLCATIPFLWQHLIRKLEEEIEDIVIPPGPTGATGSTGDTGPTGATGDTGMNGLNGSSAEIPWGGPVVVSTDAPGPITVTASDFGFGSSSEFVSNAGLLSTPLLDDVPILFETASRSGTLASFTGTLSAGADVTLPDGTLTYQLIVWNGGPPPTTSNIVSTGQITFSSGGPVSGIIADFIQTGLSFAVNQGDVIEVRQVANPDLSLPLGLFVGGGIQFT
jgi:hypothetical protein